MYDEKVKSKGKMVPCTWIGKFVDYKGTNQYRIYNPIKQIIHICRDIVFNKALQQMDTNSRTPVGANKYYGIDLSGWSLPTVSSDQGVGKTVPIITVTTTITPPVNHHEEALDNALNITNQGLYDLYDLQMHSLVGAQESKSESEPPEAEDEASFDNRFGNELPNFGPNEQENKASDDETDSNRTLDFIHLGSPAPQISQLPSPSPTQGREGLRNLPRLNY